MTKAQERGIKILNAIWNDASKDYQNVVPYLNENSNINDYGRPFISEASEYEPIQNEFITTLVNRIAFTIFETKTWENRLRRLKKGYKAPLGTDIQHVYTNPINPRKYDGNNLSGILTKYDNDTKVVYYRRNRQDVFPITVNREQLAGAFVSWEAFNTFVSNLINAVYSGNEIREFNLFKQAIVDATNADRLVTRYVEYPTADNSKDIVREIKTVSSQMQFASSNFNKYKAIAEREGATDVTPVETWTPKDRQIIIMRADILNTLSVEVLASAFNMTEVEFRDALIEVDNFDYNIYNLDTGKIDGVVHSDIAFVVGDESIFQIYDNLKTAKSQELGYSLSWQFFYHVWATIAISCLANGVVYRTTTNPKLLGIETEKTTVTLDADTTSDEIAYTFTPSEFDGTVVLDAISATKDGEAISLDTLDEVVEITIDNLTKKVTIEIADGATSGSYELKYSLHATGETFPNVIINVGVTVA